MSTQHFVFKLSWTLSAQQSSYLSFTSRVAGGPVAAKLITVTHRRTITLFIYFILLYPRIQTHSKIYQTDPHISNKRTLLKSEHLIWTSVQHLLEHKDFEYLILSLNCHFISQERMQPSKRPSLACPASLPPNQPSQKGLQPSGEWLRIDSYIEFVRVSIKKRIKDRSKTFEESELKEINNLLKAVQHYHKGQRDGSGKDNQGKDGTQIMNARHTQEINALKLSFQEQLESQQRQWSERLLALNNDNGRKQQAYKETIEKLIKALGQAQKQQQELHVKMSIKMQEVSKVLKDTAINQKKDQQVANAVRDIISAIALRQENSHISQNQADLSLQDLQLPVSRPLLRQDEHNPCNRLDINETCLSKDLQAWLIRLVCFGLFLEDNQKCLNLMLTRTKTYKQPTELLQDSVFPVIMQLLVNNMLKNQEMGTKYLQGSSVIMDCEEGSLIQYRDINSISELDTNNARQLPLE